MQNSRIAIQEAGQTETGQDRAVIDFHNAAWALADQERGYGFVLRKTTEHLGMQPEMDHSDGIPRLYVSGTVESVKERIPDLNRHIGIIAHTGARLGASRNEVGRMLGNLTQRVLPELPDDATFMRAAGVVAGPFAHHCGDDMTEIYYARKPYWHGTNEAARHADGRPMGQFEARDIGGYVIGWDGLHVQEQVPFGVALEPETANRIRLLAGAKQTRFGDEVRSAFRAFLDQPELPEVPHQPVTAADRRRIGRHQLYLPRTDVQELIERYVAAHPLEEAENEEAPKGPTISDIIRIAVEAALVKAAADPLLMQEVRAVAEEWQLNTHL